MEKTEIYKSNELIAVFMGAEIIESHNTILPVAKFIYPPANQKKYSRFELNFLKYHSSWDWLMPVVEKIESLPLMKIPDEKLPQGFEVEIKVDNCYIHYGNGAEGIVHDFLNLHNEWKGESKITIVYNSVIRFIEWYNENKGAI
jgi:hypothetical protein